MSKTPLSPPHTTISFPVHTAVCRQRRDGALIPLMGIHLSAAGSYRAPVFEYPNSGSLPPQISNSRPSHTAECPYRGEGPLAVDMEVHRSRTGSYRPPMFGFGV